MYFRCAEATVLGHHHKSEFPLGNLDLLMILLAVLWIESSFLILGMVRFLIFCKDKSFEIRSIEHLIKLFTLLNYVTWWTIN